MLNKLSIIIVDFLIMNNVVELVNKELYQYGFFILLSDIFSILLITFFGIFLNCFFESVLFYFIFRFIRIFAGGFHANTETRCEILISLLFLGSTYTISISKQVNIFKIILGITIFAILIITIFSPLDTPEKPLEPDEKKKYRKISLSILLIIVLIIIISIILKIKLFIVPCCLSLILESILLVAGVIKGRLVNGH